MSKPKTRTTKLTQLTEKLGGYKKELARPTLATYTSIKPPIQGASKAGWHKISTKLECDQKYKLQEVWGIRIPATMTPDALGVGALFHAGRAHWFDSGFPMGADYEQRLFAYLEDAAIRMALPVRDEALDKTKSYISQYITYWGARAKPTVIGTEYQIDAPLLGPGFDDRTARLDDVSYYPEHSLDKLCIGECKTTSVSVADVVKEYTLHGQPTLQTVLWMASKNGQAKHGPADAVMLDVVVKGYGKEKCSFGRVPVRITERTRQWFMHSLMKHVHEASIMTVDTPVERRITACTRLIGRMRVSCPYQELCSRGKAAATMYVNASGHALTTAKYDGEARPWD